MINIILKRGGADVTLENEIQLAQQDMSARKRRIEQNMDFIRRCASRAAGRFVDILADLVIFGGDYPTLQGYFDTRGVR